MRLIGNRVLREFALRYPQADTPLQAWRRLVERNRFSGSHAPAALFRFGWTDDLRGWYRADLGDVSHRFSP